MHVVCSVFAHIFEVFILFHQTYKKYVTVAITHGTSQLLQSHNQNPPL